MIYRERLFKILHAPHVSEKASTVIKQNNTIVFKVTKDAKKAEIKAAINKIFEVEVDKVCTLIIKGKIKRHKQHIGYRNNWKKAYITLKKGHKLDFIDGTE